MPPLQFVPSHKHWPPLSFHLSFTLLGFFPTPTWPTHLCLWNHSTQRQGSRCKQSPHFHVSLLTARCCLKLQITAWELNWSISLKFDGHFWNWLTGWFVFKLNNLWDRTIRHLRKQSQINCLWLCVSFSSNNWGLHNMCNVLKMWEPQYHDLT